MPMIKKISVWLSARSGRTGSAAKTAILAGLALLFIVSRFYLIHSPSVIQGGMTDEQQLGLFPLHLNIGLLLPFNHYQYDPYAGGEIVIGLINAVSFKYFGPNLRALKASCLLFTISLGLLLFFFLKKEFGLAEGLVGLTLFVFAPAIYLKWSLRSVANHAEAAFFILAILAAFFPIYKMNLLRRNHWPKRISLAIFTGLLCGFSLYFSYDVIIAVATITILYVLTTRLKTIFVDAAFFFFSFFIGFHPWFMYHTRQYPLKYAYGFSFGMIEEKISSGDFQVTGKNLRILISVIMSWLQSEPLKLAESIIIDGKTFDWIIVTVFACAAMVLFGFSWPHIYSALRKKISRESLGQMFSRELLYFPFLLYLPIHVLTFAVFGQRYHAGYWPQRYMLGMTPVLWIIAAVAAARLWREGRRIMAAAGVATIALACMAGSIHLYGIHDPADIASTRGYTYHFFARTMNRYYRDIQLNEEAVYEFRNNFLQINSEELLHGLYAGIAHYHDTDIDSHFRYISKQEPTAVSAFITGLGAASGYCGEEGTNAENQLKEKIPPDYSSFYRQGSEDKEFQRSLRLDPGNRPET